MEDELTNSLLAQSMDLMNFSASGIISGVLFGIIGMWMLNRARKISDFRLVVIAFALMFYPYVTRGPWADWGVGIALCALAYHFWPKRIALSYQKQNPKQRK